jgi:hypothetical protein
VIIFCLAGGLVISHVTKWLLRRKAKQVIEDDSSVSDLPIAPVDVPSPVRRILDL